ncbi:MAG: DDE-type integrase/transposase/recombinase [Candidatus Schekmanbacteria bacterium]|nr:DDE-type integrase/transposase/recombinase [Candidatus Schekmanbacteria bacterium]
MRRAVAIWGCPHLVFADNGRVYVSRQLGRICAELGVALAHAAPYHPQSKGKAETGHSADAGFPGKS